MIDNLLLCVGAQKTGTTWLHQQLRDHPDIGFSHIKEVHYFNTIHSGSILLTTRKVEHIKNLIDNNRYALEKYFSDLSGGREVDLGIKKLLSPVNDEWYIDLLKTNKKYAADFTPEYALLPNEGIENIKHVSKNQKIIFIMRDPVDRARSAVQYFYKMKGMDIESQSESDIRELALSDLIINMSSYETTLNLYQNNFKYFKYMFFETIMLDKQKAINEVTSFLDITPVTIEKSSLERRVNASKSFNFSPSLLKELRERLNSSYEYIQSNCQNIPDNWS